MAEDGDANQRPSCEQPKTDTRTRIRKGLMVRQNERLCFPVSRQFRNFVEPRIDRFARRSVALSAISPALAKQTELHMTSRLKNAYKMQKIRHFSPTRRFCREPGFRDFCRNPEFPLTLRPE